MSNDVVTLEVNKEQLSLIVQAVQVYANILSIHPNDRPTSSREEFIEQLQAILLKFDSTEVDDTKEAKYTIDTVADASFFTKQQPKYICTKSTIENIAVGCLGEVIAVSNYYEVFFKVANLDHEFIVDVNHDEVIIDKGDLGSAVFTRFAKLEL